MKVLKCIVLSKKIETTESQINSFTTFVFEKLFNLTTKIFSKNEKNL